MSDERLEELVSSYLDGELEPAEREIVRLRIENDVAWRSCWERMRRTSAAVQTFFHASADGVSLSPDGERRAVTRIVRESALASRPRRLSGWRRWASKRPGTLLSIAALAVFVGAFAIARMTGDPAQDVASVTGAAADRLGGGFHELVLTLDTSASRLAGVTRDLLGLDLILPRQIRAWVGPGGLSHVSALTDDGVIHQGFDGQRYWTWIEGQPVVHSHGVAPQRALTTLGFVQRIWDDAERALRRLADGAEKPSDVSRPGGGLMLKTRIATAPAAVEFDERRVLKRIELPGIRIDVNERKLTPRDFAIENWAPGRAIESH